MSKIYSWPHGHWNWPVNLTHQHGVRCGDFIFTGGQAALDTRGQVLHPENLEKQLDCVLTYLETVIKDLGADFSDVVKLVCYFTGDAGDEKFLVSEIASRIGPKVMPVINTVCKPALCYPAMRVEIEAMAMLADGEQALRRKNIRLDDAHLHPAFSHAVRCGDVVFTSDISAAKSSTKNSSSVSVEAAGDVIAQTRIMMDKLVSVLSACDCSCNDVVKLNVFYTGDGSAENWEEPARIRAAYFDEPGPAATGLAVTKFAHPEVMTKIFVTAMRAQDGSNLSTTYAWPDGHWDWTTKLPYKHGNRCGQWVHIGGQVSLDAQSKVLHPNDMVAQTRQAMSNVETVLHELGASLDDVVKVSTFYQGDASAEALHENLLIRSNSYTAPGPATTGVPVPYLVYPHMVIEIEVIAMLNPSLSSHSV